MLVQVAAANMHVYMHACSQLSQMIETAWKWAAEKCKLERNEVNGAEYANLEVDKVRTKKHEASSSLTMSSRAVFEDSSGFMHDIDLTS